MVKWGIHAIFLCMSAFEWGPTNHTAFIPAILDAIALLLNLVLNAIQASPEGATVTLSCERQKTSLCLVIRDRGPGIRPEICNRVFDPFFTTRDGGTGLGLAIVARIIADHGGTIDLEAPSDGGTVARLCLPVLPAEAIPIVAQRQRLQEA